MHNAVVITNGKGGVLKTSITANVAGLAAAGEWRTLAVDCDPQGNLGRDLGYINESDDGLELAEAVSERRPPAVMSNIRPGLDVVAGGPEIRKRLLPEMQRLMLSGAVDPLDGFRAAFEPLAETYDLIVFDSPPGEATLQAALMRMARWLVIPSRPDEASIDGLATVAQVAEEQRALNPLLEVLGIVLGPVPASASALRREARQELADLVGDQLHFFETTLRDAPRLAVDLRRSGLLAHEYETEASKAEPWSWKAFKAGRKAKSYSTADLAGDYQSLADEIISRMTQRLQEEVPAHG